MSSINKEKKSVRCPNGRNHNAFMIWEYSKPDGTPYYVLECIDCRNKGLLEIKKGLGRESPVSFQIKWDYEE